MTQYTDDLVLKIKALIPSDAAREIAADVQRIAGERDAAVLALAEVRDLHKHDGASDCIICGWESGWPCPTAAAVQR